MTDSYSPALIECLFVFPRCGFKAEFEKTETDVYVSRDSKDELLRVVAEKNIHRSHRAWVQLQLWHSVTGGHSIRWMWTWRGAFRSGWAWPLSGEPPEPRSPNLAEEHKSDVPPEQSVHCVTATQLNPSLPQCKYGKHMRCVCTAMVHSLSPPPSGWLQRHMFPLIRGRCDTRTLPCNAFSLAFSTVWHWHTVITLHERSIFWPRAHQSAAAARGRIRPRRWR